MEILKTLFAEAMDNVLVAGSFIFLFIAFIAAIVEPGAALLPFVLAIACYLVAYFKDQKDQ
ncbi:MAG: hypothetical protein KTR32_01185 [Granulosicoccus sp.]|nr:hypothetical protein [Granulosicoccus sp.]